MANTGGSNRVGALDLLRLFAASAVMLSHLAFMSWAGPDTTPGTVLQGATSYPELAAFTSWGWVGVEVFFVISGFVIAYSASRGDAFGFARSRFLRLVPAAWICATITLAVAISIGLRPIDQLSIQYVKTIGFWPMSDWIDRMYWTLGIEIAFYAGIFLLLALKRPAWIEPAVIVVGLVSSAFNAFLLLRFGAPYPVPEKWIRLSELALLTYGAYFAIGVLIWNGSRSGWSPARCLALGLCVAGGLVAILVKSQAPTDLSAWIVPAGIWLAAVAIVIAASIRSPAWLNTKWVATIGLATYPLYLIHDIPGVALLRQLIVSGVERYTALACTVASMIGLAVLITVTVEASLRKLLSAVLWPAKPRTEYSPPPPASG